ncbi:MAG: hypothetical protein HY394_04825 [Candidatus Diapherotrites archaeon]|nr:hypothetical protein [Candidatus Diapherotrites archaeon]
MLASAVFAQSSPDANAPAQNSVPQQPITIVSVAPKDGSNGAVLVLQFSVDTSVKKLLDVKISVNGTVLLRIPEFTPEQETYTVEIAAEPQKNYEIKITAKNTVPAIVNYFNQFSEPPLPAERPRSAVPQAPAPGPVQAPKPSPFPKPMVSQLEFYLTIAVLGALFMAAVGFLFMISRKPKTHAGGGSEKTMQGDSRLLPATEPQPSMAMPFTQSQAQKPGPAAKPLKPGAKPKAKKEIKGKAQIKRGKRK